MSIRFFKDEMHNDQAKIIYRSVVKDEGAPNAKFLTVFVVEDSRHDVRVSAGSRLSIEDHIELLQAIQNHDWEKA